MKKAFSLLESIASYTRKPVSRAAFSLVELSIVLVILGLLAGGVLTGQSLIRAAELRSITTEFSSFQTATNTFRDKYFAIPGDMNNATAFWGAMTNCGAASPSGTGTQTCDGNANRVIGAPAAASQTGEMFNFWQHLVNAGLLEGTYSGIAGTGGAADSEIGENVPAARFPNTGWSVGYLASSFAGDTLTYARNDYGNHFRFGASEANGSTQAAALTPEQAWNVDTKMDDGKPATGKIIARFWNNACSAADDGTHANNDFAASYKLTDTTLQCALFFRNLF